MGEPRPDAEASSLGNPNDKDLEAKARNNSATPKWARGLGPKGRHFRKQLWGKTVSYTHLTLPTICSV
eukprot:7114623-Prorocentrum_lima.AAC.1